MEPIADETVLAALDRILNSEAFRKTPSLRHLLQYLVTKSLEGKPEQIKESIIAIDVFSRREDFDGRIDNIVRVQAHRLRKLLDVFYAEEGAMETLRVSVPRGSYVPQFDLREHAEPLETSIPAAKTVVEVLPQPPAIPEPLPRRGRVALPAWLALAFLSGVALAGAVFWFAVPRLKGGPGIPPAVREIWSPVFENGARLIASYSNPSILRVGHLPMLLIYNGPVSAPPGAVIELGANDPYIDKRLLPKGQELHFSENWTGTGEVLAVNRLTMLSAEFQHPMSVTPSRLLSLNEMHGANVIFVGSPSVNGALAKIGLDTRPFYTTSDGRIMIRNPHAGEPSSFSNVVDSVTSQTLAAYVLFSVLPGIDADHTVVSSAGLSTAGTWAGIDYTTSATGAAQFAAALKRTNGGRLPRYYQAIIRTEIIKGSASNPSLVALRVVGGT